jgi:orotate phosphoribosyltransferase
MKTGEEFVHYAIEVGAIEFIPRGRRLKSGRISPYFFNSGFFSSGHKLYDVGRLYADTILGMGSVEVIFGPAYKGIPLSVATAIVFWSDYNIDLGSAYNRKEVKDHAEGGIVVGDSMTGKKVIIVDEALTTHGSLADSVGIVGASGGNPVGCVI